MSKVSRNSKTRELLQTVQAYACTVDSELILIRVLLDYGSQRAYTTNHLKALLKLNPVRKEKLTLNTFGSNNLNVT